MKSLIYVFTIALLISGCASPRYSVNSAKGITQSRTIHIVEDPNVRASFLKSMQDWLYQHKYDVNVLAPNSEIAHDEWTLTYHALWSWDLTIFLAEATICAFNKGIFAGEAKYLAPNSNTFSKYRKAEKTIHAMMDMLFSER